MHASDRDDVGPFLRIDVGDIFYALQTNAIYKTFAIFAVFATHTVGTVGTVGAVAAVGTVCAARTFRRILTPCTIRACFAIRT